MGFMLKHSSMTHPNDDLIALGIRQPWAELILRGIKTIEVRTLGTQLRGPIYLYTGKRLADIAAAEAIMRRHALDREELTLSRLVGTVEIVDSRPCTPADAEAACVPAEVLRGKQAWCLANPVRLDEPLQPRFLPYGVWFYPFKRRNAEFRH
jgi:hypothetical protein